jgi:phosphatidylglycerol:prolipoprotein diacylglycerol transferase
VWPELFTIPLLGLPLRSFGLLVAAGFLVGVAMGSKLAGRYGADRRHDGERFAEVSWWVLIGVILGARLAFVLVNLDHYRQHPGDILKVWEGGLVMYGGLILAVTLGVWKAKRLGMPGWQSLDYGLTAGFLGQAIGRIGCFMVGDDYGAPTDLPWAVTFPDPLPAGSAFAPELVGVPVHPAQFYMSAKALALFLLGLWLLKNKRFHGQVALLLVMGYAVLRFLVEFTRFDMTARGGWFREGLDPASVNAKLAEMGVAAPSGRITDLERYRELLREGVEGVYPVLVLSTSQIVAIVTFVLASAGLLVLRRVSALRVGPHWPPAPETEPQATA